MSLRWRACCGPSGKTTRPEGPKIGEKMFSKCGGLSNPRVWSTCVGGRRDQTASHTRLRQLLSPRDDSSYALPALAAGRARLTHLVNEVGVRRHNSDARAHEQERRPPIAREELQVRGEGVRTGASRYDFEHITENRDERRARYCMEVRHGRCEIGVHVGARELAGGTVRVRVRCCGCRHFQSKVPIHSLPCFA